MWRNFLSTLQGWTEIVAMISGDRMALRERVGHLLGLREEIMSNLGMGSENTLILLLQEDVLIIVGDPRTIIIHLEVTMTGDLGQTLLVDILTEDVLHLDLFKARVVTST